jgi:RHS repeat-associated protein
VTIDDFVFTPDGHALHVRTANTAAVSVDYLWLDDLPVAQFQDSYDAQGVYIGTEATYLHSDHLGTPRIGTNASKQITWRNRSDAFGIAALSGSAVVRLRLPGQLSLGVAGLNYNYYRDYDPKVGRYLESDPLGIEAGNNTYAYTADNPLRYRDPQGLKFCGAGSGVGEKIVPDSFSGLVSFEGPCFRHDVCYGTCGADKAKCDRALRMDMRRECIADYKAGKIWALQACLQRGDAYFFGLDRSIILAPLAFKNAQEEACASCKGPRARR